MNPLHDTLPLTAAQAPKGTARRTVPLAIGFGCLGAIAFAVLLAVGIFAVVVVSIRSSAPYQVAMKAAQHDSAVAAAMGTPVSAGWLTSGQINVSGASGHADLSIPISGPRNSGTIAVRADKTGGSWTFSTLSVQVSGHPAPLDLLSAVPRSPAAVAP